MVDTTTTDEFTLDHHTAGAEAAGGEVIIIIIGIIINSSSSSAAHICAPITERVKAATQGQLFLFSRKTCRAEITDSCHFQITLCETFKSYKKKQTTVEKKKKPHRKKNTTQNNNININNNNNNNTIMMNAKEKENQRQWADKWISAHCTAVTGLLCDFEFGTIMAAVDAPCLNSCAK